MTTEETRHIRQTVREICRATDTRPRDWRGMNVEAMLIALEASCPEARVYWGCFSDAQIEHVL